MLAVRVVWWSVIAAAPRAVAGRRDPGLGRRWSDAALDHAVGHAGCCRRCTGEANPRLAGSPGGLVALALTIGIGTGVAAPHGHRLEARLRKVGDERVAESNQRSLEAVIQRERDAHHGGHEDRPP